MALHSDWEKERKKKSTFGLFFCFLVCLFFFCRYWYFIKRTVKFLIRRGWSKFCITGDGGVYLSLNLLNRKKKKKQKGTAVCSGVKSQSLEVHSLNLNSCFATHRGRLFNLFML